VPPIRHLERGGRVRDQRLPRRPNRTNNSRWKCSPARGISGLAILAVALVGLTVPVAKADEIVFSGGSGGNVQVLGNVSIPAFHEFTLSNAPLDSLLINGGAVPFNGLLNIDAVGDTTDNGNLAFTSGSLTVSSGGGNEVASSLLGAELGLVNGLPTFLGVLDPLGTAFGDLLASQGALGGGIGGTQFQVELPIINLPSLGYQGTALDSGVLLVTTPEPNGFVLFGTGLACLLLSIFRRQVTVGCPKL
jgi:hypothetical protein